MNLDEITNNLFRTTEALKAANDNLHDAAEQVVRTAKNLETVKAEKQLSGLIDGKNEDARKAQYRDLCAEEYAAVEAAEKHERNMRLAVDNSRLDYSMAQYLLRIAELAK